MVKKRKVNDWNIIDKPAYYLSPRTITDNVSKGYEICEIAVCYGNIAVDQWNVM